MVNRLKRFDELEHKFALMQLALEKVNGAATELCKVAEIQEGEIKALMGRVSGLETVRRKHVEEISDLQIANDDLTARLSGTEGKANDIVEEVYDRAKDCEKYVRELKGKVDEHEDRISWVFNRTRAHGAGGSDV